jgi:hypothetical protein
MTDAAAEPELVQKEPEGEKNRQPSAPQAPPKPPRVLTRAELEALRARLQRKFH